MDEALSWLISLTVKARDEASVVLAKVRGEVALLRAEAERSTGGISKLDNVLANVAARSNDVGEKSKKARDGLSDVGGAAERAGPKVKNVGDEMAQGAQKADTYAKRQANAAAALKVLRGDLEKATSAFRNGRRTLDQYNDDLRQLQQRAQAAGRGLRIADSVGDDLNQLRRRSGQIFDDLVNDRKRAAARMLDIEKETTQRLRREQEDRARSSKLSEARGALASVGQTGAIGQRDVDNLRTYTRDLDRMASELGRSTTAGREFAGAASDIRQRLAGIHTREAQGEIGGIAGLLRTHQRSSAKALVLSPASTMSFAAWPSSASWPSPSS
jgi:DNA repair exonuclease SbcCD ATPase subunit